MISARLSQNQAASADLPTPACPVIQRTTKKAQQVIKTIKTADKVIRIAAAATVLAAVSMTGNAEAAIKAAEDTYEQATN